MNKIDSIIIHCSATRAGQDLTAKDIDRMHRARGFSQIGYNYVIRIDGAVEKGRSLAVDGAYIKTGARLNIFFRLYLSASVHIGRSITMSENLDYLIFFAEFSNQLAQSRFLGDRSCVCGLSVCIQTTYVANTNTMFIIRRFAKTLRITMRSEFPNFLRNTVVRP